MLVPPWNVQPFLSRTFSVTSTPLKLFFHSPSRAVSCQLDEIIDLPKLGRIDVVQSGDDVPASAREPWIQGAVMLYC